MSSITRSQRGQLPTLVVNNGFATAEISLFGAQVLSFTPKKDGLNRLWLSPHADYTGKKPIRGGIPLCWPWFGKENGRDNAALPAHGVLRTQIWTLTEFKENQDGTVLYLNPDHTSVGNEDLRVEVLVTIHIGESLNVELTTKNIGEKDFLFNGALHSYFYVDDIFNTQVNGINGLYIDKLEGSRDKETPNPYVITEHIDRVHLSTELATDIICNNTSISISHKGHDSLVVWNPWSSAASMYDMDAFGYKHMLCLETALTQWFTLPQDNGHTLSVTVR